MDVDKETLLSIYGQPLTLSSRMYKRNSYPGAMSSEKRALQFLTLNKLLQIRDYYNQGWEPNWSNSTQAKYTINVVSNRLDTDMYYIVSRIFAFKTRELRDEFFNNFKEDLEFIKEFL